MTLSESIRESLNDPAKAAYLTESRKKYARLARGGVVRPLLPEGINFVTGEARYRMMTLAVFSAELGRGIPPKYLVTCEEAPNLVGEGPTIGEALQAFVDAFNEDEGSR